MVPAAYILVPESPPIVMPTLGKFTITLIQASAQLVSDVYLYKPDSVLMIRNNLKNVGKTYDTIYPAGTVLEFAICVHPPPGKGQPYWFTSDSKHARVTKASDTLMYVYFEDLPDSVADWDYNDVVLKVELHLLAPLPSEALTIPGRAFSPVNKAVRVEEYDLRGRFLGIRLIDGNGRVLDKDGRPACGVHIVKPVQGAGRTMITVE